MAVSAPEASGLSRSEASRRLTIEGPNRLPEPPRPHPARELVRQMTHLFAGMLWIAAALAVLAGMPVLAAAIVVVVLVNGVFAFWQEMRADRAVQRLRALIPTRARVRRDGEVHTVDVEQVVEGDVVLLTAGDRVCADLRLLVGHELELDESTLTGESVATRPLAGAPLLCGTFVVQGEAEAVAEHTGARTRLAGITALTVASSRPPSPLTRELHRVVRVVSVIAVVVGISLATAAVGVGLPLAEGFLFGLGVMVALVPEGLLPTVTLSLARAGQRMADEQALVRRLDAVETLGDTSFICTDKTGTVTRNEMSVVEIWTPDGNTELDSVGYDPTAAVAGAPVPRSATFAAAAAATCVRGRAVQRDDGRWVPDGDPMEAALDVAARRLGRCPATDQVLRRLPYTADRRCSAVVVRDDDVPALLVLGAPESVLAKSDDRSTASTAAAVLADLTARGLRVLAVARRAGPPSWEDAEPVRLETQLELVGLIALQDPPREGVAEAVLACRRAGIRIAMITGDHPTTAAAVAREVGILSEGGTVVCGSDLPKDAREVAALLDQSAGAVVARVSPEDKLRVAVALREAGHVVAMTGDGVNDAPALHAADVGVAMGGSGSDVAREAADLVLLDDHFATIVTAVELGRATFANIRRFLTYHLTDNVAELTPFAVWAVTGSKVPLAIGVLQVLALDIGTDMLPALALGAEPPNAGSLDGPVKRHRLVDRAVLGRAFGVLGPTEAVGSMATFAAVLLLGGWSWGGSADASLLATASGSAFAAIAVGQLANAVACRSQRRPAWRTRLTGNPLLRAALLAELVLLGVFVGVPPVAQVLGGSFPDVTGWVGALVTGVAVIAADGVQKRLARRRPSTSRHREPHQGEPVPFAGASRTRR